MTINEAFVQLINSPEYKEISKRKDASGSMYRTWISRFNRDKLKTGAIVDILEANGYRVYADKVTKNKK